MKIKDSEQMLDAVVKAQQALARHVEPGGPTAQDTVTELLGILDARELVAIVREHRHRLLFR